MRMAHDIATPMYYTGIDPFGEEVDVPRALRAAGCGPKRGYRPRRRTARRDRR